MIINTETLLELFRQDKPDWTIINELQKCISDCQLLDEGHRELERLEHSRKRRETYKTDRYTKETLSAIRMALTECQTHPEGEYYTRFFEYIGDYDNRIDITREDFYKSFTIKGYIKRQEYLYQFVKPENK